MMKKTHLFGCVLACVATIISTSPYASIVIYDFTGTVTDAGNIAGVSASIGDTIIGEFAYDTSTSDSNPSDANIGEYIDLTITPPLMITLPGGSITFDSFTSVFVTVATDIKIAAGVPDPTVPGNNIDHDIIFSLNSSSTALATDTLPSNIELNDFNSVTGAFSSFSIDNGPAGDPIFYSIDTLALRVVPTLPVPVFIDDVNIVKNGATIFQDSFDNNIAPPDTGGNSQSYQIHGGPLGPEMNGKLTLSAADGESVIRPDTGTMTRQGARVKTNIDPLQPNKGLRIDDLFSVTGIFDLTLPAIIRERYGVRLTDSSSSMHNDSIGLSVMRTSASLVEVVLHRYDPDAFTFTSLNTVTLEPGHDQIALTLSRLDTANNDLTASFAYIDSGVRGSVTSFPTTTTIFNGEDFTRAAFMHLAPASLDEPVDLAGSIKTGGGDPICAMVLTSGQFMFSCNPVGVLSLTDLPRENDGTVKRQIYADGFFPKIDILAGSSDDAVVMTRSGTCPSYNMPYDPAVVPGSAGTWMDISGAVEVGENGAPVCAMVLANGQHMFSCDGSGSYALNIPLDTNGQFKLQVYADGFAPTIQTFDEFQPMNDVQMARAVECQ
jgi:hypothetical protein